MNQLTNYIEDLQRFAEEALSFIQGMSKEDFLQDRKTQQAATLNLITLGEISTILKNKAPHFLARSTEISWKDISGMRHRLVHGYNDINPNVVWDTLTEYVPKLLEQIPSLMVIANELDKHS